MEWVKEFMHCAPWVAAFVLGILTVASPCQIAANIAAVGFIGKVENNCGVYAKGLGYLLGRAAVYVLLGICLIPLLRCGANLKPVEIFFTQYGELSLGIFLTAFGLLLIVARFFHRHSSKKHGGHSCSPHGYFSISDAGSGFFGAFLMGVAFAAAFCPSSALFYFGMLIPMAAAEKGGAAFPTIFALGTALPVLATAWLAALGMKKVSVFADFSRKYEAGFLLVLACAFLCVGLFLVAENLAE